MSLWILQSEDHANKPLSFEDLAELLVDEVVHEWEMVRAADGSEWQSVDSVIGLCRTAGRIRAERTLRKASAQIEAEERIAKPSKLPDGSLPLKEDAIPGESEFHSGTSQTGRVEAMADATIAKINPTVSTPTSPSSLSLSAAVSPVWGLIVCAVIGGISWLGWSVWQESRRFPVPAHLQRPSQPWNLPVLGNVSGFEMSLLVFDVIAVLLFARWWLRGRQRDRK
jgi:hypothetical protein